MAYPAKKIDYKKEAAKHPILDEPEERPEPEELEEDQPQSREHIFKRGNQMAKVSWMMRDAKEHEIRKAFKEMSLPEALDLLAQARKNIEIAATVLNQRIGEEAEKETCTTCGGPPKRNGLWIMQGVDKDPETGLLTPYRYCDAFCVRDRNKKKLGIGQSNVRVDGQDMRDIR